MIYSNFTYFNSHSIIINGRVSLHLLSSEVKKKKVFWVKRADLTNTSNSLPRNKNKTKQKKLHVIVLKTKILKTKIHKKYKRGEKSSKFSEPGKQTETRMSTLKSTVAKPKNFSLRRRILKSSGIIRRNGWKMCDKLGFP